MSEFLLQEIVTAQASRWPESAAVAWRHNVLRYRELEERANQLARALRDVGVRRGDRVCVLSPRAPEAVVAILAILKADGIVVSLDLAVPAARLAKVVELCNPRCLLTFSSGAALVDELFQCGVPCDSIVVGALGASPIVGQHFSTSFCAADVALMPTRPLAHRNRPANPAQIVFNHDPRSAPRGVVLTHGSIRRLVLWANDYFGVMPGDRHSWQSALSEGASIYNTIGTLAAGASLHPVPSDSEFHPAKLAEFVRDERLTMWLVPPQTLVDTTQLAQMRSDDFPQLRNVVWHGASVPSADLREWMTRLRHVSFTRLYGAPEATIVSCYHRLSREPERDQPVLPVGRSRPGEEVLVLDGQLRPVSLNQVGEIHIRGLGVSPGYWRDPEGTAAEFPKNPRAAVTSDRLFRTGDLARVGVDGQVYPVGRRDRRVSYGLEFAAIEAALKRLGSVRTAAVVAVRTGEAEGPVFGCAYVPVPGLDVTPAALCADLAALLPPHMLPSHWRSFDELPRVADGTIDSDEIRRSLAENNSVSI